MNFSCQLAYCSKNWIVFQQVWVMLDSFAKAFSYSNRYFCVKLFILESKTWFRGTVKEILQKIILVWIAVFWAHHLAQIAKPNCNKPFRNCNLKKNIFRIYWEHFEWIKSFETNGPIVLNYRMSKSWVSCPKIICILLLLRILQFCVKCISQKLMWIFENATGTYEINNQLYNLKFASDNYLKNAFCNYISNV